ncbi:MAG TPA: peroxiredoxin [Chthoniobacterales bacterium]|jgi:peroxiredoxin Q/BCP|nr:peroxiredoxin [Chthoniobacterales bacterium]
MNMRLLFALFVLLSGLVVVVRAATNQQTNGKLKIGDPIPAVTADDQNGKPVNLAEDGSTGYTLVYFYPKAMSPGCTAQACSLRDSYSELQSKGVRIFGVSLDTVEAQKKFVEEDHLPFALLSDRGQTITSAFGVPVKLNAFASRQAYLFKDGKLIWLDTHASTDKQAQDVLAFLAQQS